MRQPNRIDITALKAISSIVAAWIVYFAIRGYMTFGLGFRTSAPGMFYPGLVWFNLAHVRVAFSVFQGLWIWLPIGLSALWLRRSIIETIGFAGLIVLMLAVALVVGDFYRSTGYMLLLLLVGCQSAVLSEGANRLISRSCFVLGLGLGLINPVNIFNTMLHDLRSLFVA
jgi:hypothetical protein